MDCRLSAIHLYPVKGIRGVTVPRAEVEPPGLRHDRRWLVVDPQGQFLSQRTHPRLAQVTGRFDGRQLALAAPGKEPLELETPAGNRRLAVTVWRDRLEAAAADPAADRWISEFLGQRCRLAFMDAGARRPVSSGGGRPGDRVSFADGYPCLLISTASLDDLNARLAARLPVDRFRPNLVVNGVRAFAEDTWRKIRIGGAEFRFAGLCPRCSVTTVDQQSGQVRSAEPLQTLGSYRRTPEGVMFGVNLVPTATGPIAVGDQVIILEHDP
jgi:uncharacterized protein YcbX